MQRKLPGIYMLLFLLSITGLSAQDTNENNDLQQLSERTSQLEKKVEYLSKLKISGYIQTQFQYGQKDAALKTGSKNENPEESFNRIGIRRGRLKFTYEDKPLSAVFQLDITDKGVGVKDAYLNMQDPWKKAFSLRAGIFDRPFGYEISYSSSKRESPERSTIFTTLFPDERDLGAMLVFQPVTDSYWRFLKIQAGLFAGNGIQRETDSRKDFIGHISFTTHDKKKFKYGVGVSYYNGGVYQGTDYVYKIKGNGFVADSLSNKAKYAKREYFGADFQLSYTSSFGETQLRGEYLTGQQPATKEDSKSPNASVLPSGDTYIRNFHGGYILFIQRISTSPVSVVVKYDWYDPNTKISKNEAGLNNTGNTDLLQQTVGVGALWDITPDLRLQGYYDFNSTEKSTNIPETENLKSDIFTLRLQYKF